jgi:predicted fused transcriptional regulator/phosphomethylpyrimidine kinase
MPDDRSQVRCLIPANDIEPAPDLVADPGGSGTDPRVRLGRRQAGCWVFADCRILRKCS